MTKHLFTALRTYLYIDISLLFTVLFKMTLIESDVGGQLLKRLNL